MGLTNDVCLGLELTLAISQLGLMSLTGYSQSPNGVCQCEIGGYV